MASSRDPSADEADGAVSAAFVPPRAAGEELPEDDGWDDDGESERKFAILCRQYASGPGKAFQDQKLFGDEEFPQLKLTNIPAGCESQAVRRECEACGAVESFRFVPGKRDGDPAHAFVAFKSSPSAAKALDHLNSLPLGIRAKPAKTKEQKEKEAEELRRTNETLRSCGYTNVRDNPGDHCLLCTLCGRDERRFDIRHCAGCKKAAYCSKACQTKDWPSHKRDCDERLEKLRRRLEERAAAARKKVDVAAFKSFDVEELTASREAALVSLTPPTPGTIWGVADPGLFGVILDGDDDPLEYYLLSTRIQEFVESKSVFAVVENPRVGELVIAKCEEEGVHARAVVLKVCSGEKSADDDDSGGGFCADQIAENLDITEGAVAPSRPECVVDLWFVDVGYLQSTTSSKELIPIRDFWEDLEKLRTLPFNESLRVERFVDLPARLIPCFLHAADPDTGESRKLVPSSFPAEDPISTVSTTSTSAWLPEAISMLKRFTSYSLDVSVKDRILPTGSGDVDFGAGGGGVCKTKNQNRSRFPFPVWGVELTKDLGVDLFLDVGSSFFNEGWADFEGEDFEEDDDEAEEGKDEEVEGEDVYPRTLPQDVSHLPLEDGVVIITHYLSPTNFFVVNQHGGSSEMERMQEPIKRSVDDSTPFGLRDAKPLIGDLVLALYQDLMYRAVVLSLVDEDHAKVHFIDWGNTEIVSLSLIYGASAEIASFRCPSSRCSVSPEELRIPGAIDIALRILTTDASDELKIKIVSRPRDEELHLDGAPKLILPPPIYHVTLIDTLGRRSRDLAENLAHLPRLKDVKLRRDLFLKQFPCYLQSVELNDGAETAEAKREEEGTVNAAAADEGVDVVAPKVDMVVVPKEENEKLKHLNEDLITFYAGVKAEDYFYPRSGQIVVGKDRDGMVMRFQVTQDVAFGDWTAKVFSLDYGYHDSILASSLRRLPPDDVFVDLPIQSLRCRLKDAPPTGSPRLTALLNVLEDAIQNQQAAILCEIDRIVDGVYWVHLFVDKEGSLTHC